MYSICGKETLPILSHFKALGYVSLDNIRIFGFLKIMIPKFKKGLILSIGLHLTEDEIFYNISGIKWSLFIPCTAEIKICCTIISKT
jgi:hypothetical protein